MGITGLLPFLEKASRRTNVSQFAGATVAVDSYCWLHKGAFSCAEKLAMGQHTDAYVTYCMKLVQMLLAQRIKPILVFDGRHLPAKAQTEAKRREARQANRQKAAELIKRGHAAEGRNLLRRSVDITHEMALELIKRCQEINVDCIVAPYEADAELAYLNRIGIADVVITEDSDLTLFGCTKVLFKMDINGNGLLVEQDRLHLALGIRSEHFDMDKFLYMCILSGCDYLPSLSGIGLAKARKFITLNTDDDIYRALTRLGHYLNMKSLVVPQEYKDAFLCAVVTFKHQLVFCPIQRKQVRLNPPTPEVTEDQLHYAGTEVDANLALQLAYGNCDPFTFKVLHDFDPDRLEQKLNAWNLNRTNHVSIWSKQYKLKSSLKDMEDNKNDTTTWPNTVGQVQVMQIGCFTNVSVPNKLTPRKRERAEYENSDENILEMYEESKHTTDINMDSSVTSENVSPVLSRKANPFAKKNKVSPSLLSMNRYRHRYKNSVRIRRTSIDNDVVTESKYFSNSVEGSQTSSISEELQKENEEQNKSNAVHSEDFISEHRTHFCTLNEDKSMGIEKENSLITHEERKVDDNAGNVTESTNNDTECLKDSVCTPSSTDDDYLVSQQDINDIQSSLARFSNTKEKEPTEKKPTNFRRKSSSTLRTNPQSKTSNAVRRMKSVEHSQSLLSKFGFQKKSLKH